MTRYRPSRFGQIFFLLGGLVIIGRCLWSVSLLFKGRTTSAVPLAYLWGDTRDADSTILALGAIQTDLAQAAALFDHQAVFDRFRLNLTRRTMEEYTASLRSTWEEFFLDQSSPASALERPGNAKGDVDPNSEWDIGMGGANDKPRGGSARAPSRQPQAGWINRILAHTSLTSPAEPSPPLRKTIWTTDLNSYADRSHPLEYAGWLRENPGWTVEWFQEDRIDEWVEETFGRGAPISREMKSMRQDWGILRSDIFRYLVLLVEGGMYADSDTGCVRPISTWWKNALRPAHRQATFPSPPSFPQRVWQRFRARMQQTFPVLFASLVVVDEEPSLLVSPEGACPEGFPGSQADPHCGQIAGHAFLAKPWHPVLLDVLTDGLRTWKSCRQAREKGEEIDVPGVLGWFGPYALSEAVYRWLLVRYGVQPTELEGIKVPHTYGTTTILPPRSFNAWCWAPGTPGLCNWEDTVWHGVAGRWRAAHDSGRPDL